jgi:hypothetical protein
MGIAMTNPHTTLAARSTESTYTPKMASVALPMELATTKPLVAPMLERDTGQQDDAVATQFASVALPIGMATAKPTTAPTVMV